MTAGTQIDNAIEPVYAFNPHGGVALLHEGPLAAKLTGGGKERIYNGQGRVLFQLAPEPAIPWEVIARVANDTKPIESPTLSELVVPEFSDLTFGDPFAIEPVPDISRVDGANSRYWGGLERTQIGNPDNLSELRYHLIGLPFDRGTHDVIYPNSRQFPGRTSLTADSWRIDIDVWPDWSTIEGHRLIQGPFPAQLVRMCRIRRDDGSLFSANSPEVESLRFTLVLFLSFVSGRLVGAALPAGLDENGEKQYVEWCSTLVDPIARFKSWYPEQRPECINQILSPFLELAQESKWHLPLVTLIRSYAAVNALWTDFGFGVGIAFVAFESLSHQILVLEERELTRRQYKANSTAMNLRLLLQWADIPRALPDDLAALVAAAQCENRDAPDVLAWIRNQIVHADNRHDLHRDAVHEAWTLSLWYLELLLLRLFSYRGPYTSRVEAQQPRGEYPLVPWAAQAD